MGRFNILLDDDGYASAHPTLMILRFFAFLPRRFALDHLFEQYEKRYNELFPINDLIILATSFDYHQIYFIAKQMIMRASDILA